MEGQHGSAQLILQLRRTLLGQAGDRAVLRGGENCHGGGNPKTFLPVLWASDLEEGPMLAAACPTPRGGHAEGRQNPQLGFQAPLSDGSWAAKFLEIAFCGPIRFLSATMSLTQNPIHRTVLGSDSSTWGSQNGRTKQDPTGGRWAAWPARSGMCREHGCPADPTWAGPFLLLHFKASS